MECRKCNAINNSALGVIGICLDCHAKALDNAATKPPKPRRDFSIGTVEAKADPLAEKPTIFPPEEESEHVTLTPPEVEEGTEEAS